MANKMKFKDFLNEGIIGKKKQKPDTYHIVNKDGKPVELVMYPTQDEAQKVRDEKYPNAIVRQVGARGKVKSES